MKIIDKSLSYILPICVKYYIFMITRVSNLNNYDILL